MNARCPVPFNSSSGGVNTTQGRRNYQLEGAETGTNSQRKLKFLVIMEPSVGYGK